ncbi:DUF1850 domain-containing protein [Salipaludibacillus neizhouensis]|uniref:DUF1850 domain-containing protein n=1 Tax=Salipaludibacillus neizhouensis TaxID=885475 RepID=UPI00167D3A4F|nr:DUF1850 domain-containing protein [Salipaludibacillus neizhouensis]
MLATFIIAGTLTVSFFHSSGDKEDVMLVFQHARTGNVISQYPVTVESEITLSWIHSVEKTPWHETYQVQDDHRLLLKRTSFQSYGAGVDHQKGEIKIENGFIIYENINEYFDELSWIHSHRTKHEITMDDETILSVTDLPHHEPIKLSVEKR